MSVYCISFSPTGGTASVAGRIAFAISKDAQGIELCCRQDALPAPLFTKEDLCIVAVPSFGGRVPGLCTRYLQTLRGNGAAVAAVVVYGNRAYEDTLSELAAVLENKGFRVIAGVAAIAEHSVIRRFAANRPNADDREELASFARQIDAVWKSNALHLRPIFPGNIPDEPRKDSAMPIITTMACVQCGACAARCPVEAIDLSNAARVDTTRCIGCMRCVAVCYHNARILSPDRQAALDDRLAPFCTVRQENELFLPDLTI